MVVDLHEDIASYFMMDGATFDVRPFDENAPERHADIPKYRKMGMRLVLGSIFPMVGGLNLRHMARLKQAYRVWSPSSSPGSARDIAIEQVKIYYSLEALYPKDLKIVRRLQDIEDLETKTGILMHLEGCEALYEPEDLQVLFNLGVRSIGLTWNYDNKYASSCMSKKDYGLTGEGEDLVVLANELSVMLDLSHAGPKSCADVIDCSDRPPFFSHSNASSLQGSRRNISNELIKKVARAKGIVGLTFIRSCIGPPYTPSRLVDHARKLIALGGNGLPALGTDFLGMGTTPDGLENLSKLGNFVRALKGAGLSQQQVEGITQDNAMRLIRMYAEGW
jgi:membrane dipeptidase